MIFNEVQIGFIDQDGWEILRGREEELGPYPFTETIWG